MNQMEQEPKKKKSGCGCFGWGCLTIIALFALVIVGIYYFVNKMVMEYTTDTPIALAEVAGTPEEFAAVEAKLSHFVAGLKGTEPADPLVLTDRDINLFLVNLPELNEISDKVRVKLDGDQIGIQVNVPLAEFGWAGRFVSGEGTLTASIEKNDAVVKIKSLTLNGSTLPDEVMKKLQDENLAEELFKKPEQKKLLEAVDLVIVKNGKIIIVGKKGALSGTSSGGLGEAEDSSAEDSDGPPVAEPIGIPPRPAGSGGK